MTRLLIDLQDIRAEEAKKDWKGPRAIDIQQLMEAVANSRRDKEIIDEQIEEYAALDNLSEEGKDIERELHRDSRKAK